MSSRMGRTKVSLFVLLIASFGFYGCGSESHSKPSQQDSSKASIPVEVASAETGTISAYYGGTATLEAEDEALVVNRVAGIVKEIFVEEGDRVEPGQLLAKLDDERLAVEMARAQSNLNKLKADLTRNKELFEKKLISAEQYQNALYDYETQKSVVELAKLDLKFTEVRAPISGVISERMIKRGNLTAQNSEMFRITDFDPLLAVMYVPEKEIAKIAPGQRVALSFDAMGELFEGTVARISPVVDQETGTLKTTIEVRDESNRLKPGMFARVRIVYDTHTNTILIPKNAVVKEDATQSVFVVRDRVAHKVKIRTGYEETGRVEVLSGITLQDTIVTLGQASLQDSSLVEPLNL